MSNLKMPDVHDLDSARAFLGDRQERKLAHNTTIWRGLGGDVVVTYHHTDIVTYCNDGRIILRADGWVTATTANRMHHLTPWPVGVGRQQGSFRVTLDGWETTDLWDGYGTFSIPPATT